MTYADRMHKSLIGRAGDWLARKRHPYWVMLLSYAVAAWVSFQSSVSLRYLGVTSTSYLYPLSFSIGYFAFATILGLWVVWLPSVNRAQLLEGASRNIETPCPDAFLEGWADSANQTGTFSGFDSSHGPCGDASADAAGGGLLGVAIALVVAGFILSVIFCLYYSRWCLGSLMVHAGKVEHPTVGKKRPDAWLLAPFRQTLWPAVALLIHVTLLGSLIPLVS